MRHFLLHFLVDAGAEAARRVRACSPGAWGAVSRAMRLTILLWNF
jgi:hypothetical protein